MWTLTKGPSDCYSLLWLLQRPTAHKKVCSKHAAANFDVHLADKDPDCVKIAGWEASIAGMSSSGSESSTLSFNFALPWFSASVTPSCAFWRCSLSWKRHQGPGWRHLQMIPGSPKTLRIHIAYTKLGRSIRYVQWKILIQSKIDVIGCYNAAWP